MKSDDQLKMGWVPRNLHIVRCCETTAVALTTPFYVTEVDLQSN